jgi:DNA-binding HxlR family transcriptional regulator
MRKSSPGGSVMDAQCPSRLVLDRIADKWTALIIQVLANGTKRYAELQREIGGISQKMLTQTLRSLERDGLVQRKVHPVVPPKVEYSLTKLGRTLIEPLHGLCRWSEKHLAELQANRARAKGSAITGQNVGGNRKLTYFAGNTYTLGRRTADRAGLDSTVTLIGATPDGKLAIVRDSTGKTAHVKFANLGVPVIDGVPSTVKGWARAK